ncbi:MAG: hypothetical protein IPM85_14830 [Chitinophagaceae bacterium]|nr:hypothetical protein [Chitinophagaceae bacterium]
MEFISIERIDTVKQQHLMKRFMEGSIADYKPNDNCLLVINRFVNKENFYDIKLSEKDSGYLERNCYSNKLPIPNFWHTPYTTNSTDCKLPLDFVIYVLESQKGKYFSEDLLTDGKFMPLQWRNGFSRGVAISKNRGLIIYWLAIW